MWPLVLFGFAAVAVVASVEYLLLPRLLVARISESPRGGRGAEPQFRPGVMPFWVAGMTAVGYLAFAGWEALSPQGNDTGVYFTGLAALAAYEVVAHKMPSRRALTGLPRFGAEMGLVLGMLLWVVVHL